MIPHEEIRTKSDRTWTLELLQVLRNSSVTDDLSEVCETLMGLQDYRAVQPLLQLLEDPNLSSHVRQAASLILRTSCIGLNEQHRRNWWHSHDELLVKHAVLEARTSEVDLLLPIANDPTHKFHAESIRALQFGFEEPEYQRLSIKALSHPDAEVRQAGARNLIWHESIDSEEPLIMALLDESDDVATEALTTISYFRSQRVLRALSILAQSAPENRREEIDGVLCAHEYNFVRAYRRLEGESKDFFYIWLKPVESLLLLDKEEKENKGEEEFVRRNQSDVPEQFANAEELIELFADINANWWSLCCRLRGQDWNGFSEVDRKLVEVFFQEHEDPHIREIGCTALAKWNRGDLLEAFLLDGCFGVRRAAAHCLREVAPDPKFAPSLWAEYQDSNCTDSRASETLSAFVVHASREGLEDILAEIAWNEQRISRKTAAINELIGLDAHHHLKDLLKLLDEPPLLNWNVHIELVEYCVEQKLSVPHFAELCTADDLRLQEALARAVPYLKSVGFEEVSAASLM